MNNRNTLKYSRVTVIRQTLLVAIPAVLCGAPAFAQTVEPPSDTEGVSLEEVTVTATRHAESLSKVPISVSAFTQDQMDAQGVKQLDDLVRLTPGLSFTNTSAAGANQIAIRGISSSAGSGTTGIYIDDTPIQVRNLGFASGTALPGLFDIERVEVLRGPQGTLFGAGSEGGTIRFIQVEPDLSHYSGYARAELANTENGAPSYESGAAFGGPIIADELGFRVSAFLRRDGGYINQVNGTYRIVDPTGAAYGNSVDFTPTQTVSEDANWKSTVAVRAALKYAPTDNLTFTPSFFYQKQHVNDSPDASYWLSQSDLNTRSYSRPYYFAGDPQTDPSVTALSGPNNQPGDDQFILSAFGINWNLGPVRLISNTSYFDRHNVQWYDYTKVYLEFYELAQFPGGGYAPPGWKSDSAYSNGQKNFIQEFRVQSNDTQSRVTWVAGAFFSRDKQTAYQPTYVNFLANAPYVGFGPGDSASPGGPPYGPGSTAFQNFLGVNQGPNSLQYYADWQTIDQQLAAFAQADFKLTKKLTLTTGVRVSRTKLNYNAGFSGPDNNAAAPFGLACLPGTYCATPADSVPVGAYAVGTGPFTASYPSSTASSSQTATTPKVGASYHLDDDNMLYASAAKGFRPAGASLRVPSICQGDLETFGYVDAQGHSTQPLTYGSDSVWSYELGSKNRLFDGHLVLDGSVYWINWKQIQTDVFLPDCAYDFVANLADATSRGFDFGFQALLMRNLTLSGTLAYNDATFSTDAKSPSGVVIYRQGEGIPGAAAPWTASLSGEYDFHLFTSRDFYLRADYTRTSQERPTGAMVAGTPQYDPLLLPNAAYGMLNARLGMRFAGVDVSLFVNNLTNAAPLIGLAHSTVYDTQDWTAEALRPRTYGLTLTYRN
jgi:iron complex outermembrane receptor protein